MTERVVALVAGVGDGLGKAVAKRFAQAGHIAVLVARKQDKLERIAHEIRTEGGEAVAMPADLRKDSEIKQLFEGVANLGRLDVVVFNAGAQHRQPFLDVEPGMFEKVWRLGCYAGFVVGQEAARLMAPNGKGTILFTGATSAMRGGAEFVTFAAAKAGLRSVSQSMARTLGPMGVHVCHFVIDGVIDMPAIHERFPDLVSSLPEQRMLSTDAIAQSYYDVHCQDRSAWSLEVDLRPWCEKFEAKVDHHTRRLG
ncbi:MAG: SDR family NAD(P)-dependent oxidoreductase [Gammaproteobacteria bacterium]